MVLCAGWKTADGELNKAGVALLLTLARYLKSKLWLLLRRRHWLTGIRVVTMVQRHHLSHYRRQPRRTSSLGRRLPRHTFRRVCRATFAQIRSNPGSTRPRLSSPVIWILPHSLRWHQRTAPQLGSLEYPRLNLAVPNEHTGYPAGKDSPWQHLQ